MKIRQFNFRFWTFQNNKFEAKTSILQIVELISNFKLVFTLYLLCHNILFFQNSNFNSNDNPFYEFQYLVAISIKQVIFYELIWKTFDLKKNLFNKGFV